jgi:hypothetical protein
MATDDQDLVSQITVTGGEEATAQVQSFADKSSAAFDKLDQSVTRASNDISKSANQIATSSQKAATGVAQVNQAAGASKLQQFNDQLGSLQKSIQGVTDKFPQLVQAVGRFTQRLATATAGAAAAGVGLALAASKVANTVNGTSDALQKQTQAQIDANNASLTQQQAYINLDAAQRKLQQDALAGKITWVQYFQALQQLNKDFDEQQRTAAQTAAAQEAVKKANDDLQKSLKDREAFNQLIDTLGGPLLTSLLNFGNTVNQIKQSFIQNFGPALAGLVDQINSVIGANLGAINKFFVDASNKIQQLIANNGPQLQLFLTNIGKAAAAVFDGIIAAAPSVIDFFNNTLVPAITKVIGFFNGLASTINAVFGTQLTAGSIIIIALLAQVTGSIRLLTTLLRLFGAVGKASFGVLGEAITIVSTLLGGGKLSAQVIKFGVSVSTAGGAFKTFFSILKSGIPLLVTLTEIVATTLGVSFGAAAIAVAALGVALFFIIKNIDWKAFAAAASQAITDVIAFFTNFLNNAKIVTAAVVAFFVAAWQLISATNQAATQAVIDAWNATVDFFKTLATNIGDVLSAAWDGIQSAASAAAALVVAAWNGVLTFFQNLSTGIQTLIGQAWTFITSSVGAIAQGVIDAWNAVVTFFQALPATLQSVWDNIKNSVIQAFTDAWNAAKDATTKFVNSVLSVLQPVLDAIKAIGAFFGSDSGSGGGGTVGQSATFAAEGGHIRGPGGPTGDKIPAWLSDGEWVMRARAVKKYGLGFMHAVNRGLLDIRGFSFGGGFVAPAPRVAFAGGGAVSGSAGLRALNLTIGNDTFEGLLMPEDVGNKLTKYAVAKQNRSAGRKPSWVGNRRN